MFMVSLAKARNSFVIFQTCHVFRMTILCTYFKCGVVFKKKGLPHSNNQRWCLELHLQGTCNMHGSGPNLIRVGGTGFSKGMPRALRGHARAQEIYSNT